MEKLKSSLKNMLVVLTVISIIAAGVLASVNAITAPQIEKINADNLAAGIKAVMGADDITVAEPQEIEGGYTAYAVSDAQGETLGTAVTSTTNGFGGPLQVLVGFDNEGTILGYTILAHTETPGLGAKASDWFQKGEKGDIIGKNPGQCDFTVSKDGGEIDAITASTITSRAFLKAIQNAYDTVIAGNTDGATGATTQASKAVKKHEGCKHECEGKKDCKNECDADNCDVEKCGNAECTGDCENKHNCPKDKSMCSHSHNKCPHASDMGTPEVIE